MRTLTICLLVSALGCNNPTSPTSNPTTGASTSTPTAAQASKPESPLEITGTQLYEAYHKNPIEFEKSWKGRKVIVTARIWFNAGNAQFDASKLSFMLEGTAAMRRDMLFPVYLTSKTDFDKLPKKYTTPPMTFKFSGVLDMGPAVKQAKLIP